MNDSFRPHDLLWLRAGALPAPLPAWARADWPVVVRRAEPPSPALVPVGLRGPQRADRHASWASRADVLRAASPETLAAALRDLDPQDAHPLLRALHALAPRLDALGLAWGPAGSTAFALATGAAVLREGSDLDLLVRVPTPPAANIREGLRRLQQHAACRLDIQLDTGTGGFALAEWLAAREQVLLKTARGPILVADPWSPPPPVEIAA